MSKAVRRPDPYSDRAIGDSRPLNQALSTEAQQNKLDLNDPKYDKPKGILSLIILSIRDLSPVPSGYIYSACMMNLMSLETFNIFISQLESRGVIEVKDDLITWIDPKEEVNNGTHQPSTL